MTKILLSCVKWLKFTGIVTIDNDRSADMRLGLHFLMVIIFLAPRVTVIKYHLELNIIVKKCKITDLIHIYSGC